MNLAFPSWMTVPPTWLLPWHVALAIGALFLVGFAFSRLQFQRAREDWANAFFYSPSSKTKQRHRRQRWQDRMWASLLLALACAATAGVLYLSQPR